MKAITIAKNKDRFYNLVGLMHYFENRMPDAILNYKKALEINNAEPVYWSNIALAYRDAGNFSEAEKKMSKAVELDPSEKYRTRLEEIKKLSSNTSSQK